MVMLAPIRLRARLPHGSVSARPGAEAGGLVEGVGAGEDRCNNRRSMKQGADLTSQGTL